MGAQHPGKLIMRIGALDRQIVSDDIAMLLGKFGERPERGG
jgi:hypothetical protein